MILAPRTPAAPPATWLKPQTEHLTLKGHAIDAAGKIFVGLGVGVGIVRPIGFGTGLLDVDKNGAGIANGFFDTDSIVALFWRRPCRLRTRVILHRPASGISQ